MERMKEVSKRDWVRFLDDFTRDYQGCRVRVEVQDPESGPMVEALDLPLQGAAADHRRGAMGVAVIVGDEVTPALTRIVRDARRLRVEVTPAGNIAALEIDAGDGSKTLVRLLQVPRAA